MTRVLHRILLALLAPTVLVACGPPGVTMPAHGEQALYGAQTPYTPVKSRAEIRAEAIAHPPDRGGLPPMNSGVPLHFGTSPLRLQWGAEVTAPVGSGEFPARGELP